MTEPGVAAPLMNLADGMRTTDIETQTFVARPLTARSAAGRIPGRSLEDDVNLVTGTRSVRRLTPVECERLQGFPDDWTLVDGLKCPDSRRYAAMGNAVTVNVAEWIGQRIVALDAIDAKTTTTP